MYYAPYDSAGIFGTIFVFIWYLMMWLCANAAVVLELIGLWFTYKKMHLPGWKGIIPFYNVYVLFEKLWDIKQFWRVLIYLGVYFGTFLFGLLFTIFGSIFAATGHTSVPGIVMLIVGVMFLMASLVMVILALVVMFGLYRRMAQAFRLQPAWAWGLLFVPYIMLPIIAFNKRIIYYGPVYQGQA